MADKQVVLITGSNKGIGLALARQYSEAGYKVSFKLDEQNQALHINVIRLSLLFVMFQKN
jgi:NAD(P)-dependent dehydrogenase (short-subunit alcohol dehydrogenase family)